MTGGCLCLAPLPTGWRSLPHDRVARQFHAALDRDAATPVGPNQHSRPLASAPALAAALAAITAAAAAAATA